MRDIIPAAATIIGAPDTMMILLIEHITIAGRSHHVMDAMADIAITRRGRMVVVPAFGSV